MPEIVLPKMHESLLNEEWYKQTFEQQVKAAYKNPWTMSYLKAGLKEGILSDMAGALGAIHDTVVNAAKPNLVGREIIDVRTTSEALERFPRAKKSVAYVASETGTLRIHGERYDTVDVSTNILIKDGAEWSREFAEDAKWNVLNRQLEELGRSLAEKETEKVLALYAAIATADLASGGVLAGGGTAMSWTKTVQLFDAIDNEDFPNADTLVLHVKQANQMMTATEFINNQYLPSGSSELTRGLIGQALTMKIYKTSKATNGVAHTVNKAIAGVMLIRRDVTVEDYQDTKNNVFGLVASERVGLAILRSKAVARMTNIGTTL